MYVLHLRQIERWVLAERQNAVALIAAGAKDVTLPDLDSARAEFEAALSATPRVIDPERLELMRALGVAS